jgi:hypothetical protein
MATKPLERLLFAQGDRCFFCNEMLSPADASVEHLVAKANGGPDNDENCVACCKSLNALFGRMSLKEKLRVVLNRSGAFRCPNGHRAKTRPPASEDVAFVVTNLQKRGNARPRTIEKLTNTVDTLFNGQHTQAEVEAVLNELQHHGVISVHDGKVSYTLPTNGA